MRLDTATRRVRLSWTNAAGEVVETDDLMSLERDSFVAARGRIATPRGRLKGSGVTAGLSA